MEEKKVVVSGIRATGKLHIGNYLGAMKDFVALQDHYRCFFFVADYHTLTTHPDPQQLRENLPEIVLDYLAAGLDPEKVVIYAQSSVPQVAELCLLLSMVAYKGELERCATFKEKARQQPDNVNLGLLAYPVLMAADVLIHKANLVPVGEDQVQHLEMARDFAQRFNRRYGEIFPLPYPLQREPVRVPGLDGKSKMGKSEGNTIDLTDDPDTIRRKVMKAVTDSDPIGPDFSLLAKQNVLYLHRFFSTPEEIQELEGEMRAGRAGYKVAKELLAERIIRFLTPFQERRRDLAARKDYVREVLHEGGKKARESAQKTLDEARELMGLVRY